MPIFLIHSFIHFFLLLLRWLLFFCSPFVCASSFVQIKYKSFGRRGIFILASVSKKELYIKTKAKRKKNETKQNYLSFENRWRTLYCNSKMHLLWKLCNGLFSTFSSQKIGNEKERERESALEKGILKKLGNCRFYYNHKPYKWWRYFQIEEKKSRNIHKKRIDNKVQPSRVNEECFAILVH